MLVLAIDTSGRNGSLALVRGGAGRFECLELLPLAGRMYSAQLIPQLEVALERQGLDRRDLEAFAVASGPGSFTGLRVGLSTVKALAEILRRPIGAVSVLEAAARQVAYSGHVIVALDAGRKQVFVGDYEFSGAGKVREYKEALILVDDFFRSLQGSSAQIATPDEAIAMAARAHGINMSVIAAPQANSIARLGIEKIEAGETVTPEALEPNYIRPSDAELFSLPKLRQSTA